MVVNCILLVGVIYSLTSIAGAAPHRATYAILKQSGFNVNKGNSNYIYHYCAYWICFFT